MSNIVAHIYKQAFDDDYFLPTIDVNNFDSEYIQIDCTECRGTGIYILPDDDTMTCVDCKGSGKMWVNLY